MTLSAGILDPNDPVPFLKVGIAPDDPTALASALKASAANIQISKCARCPTRMLGKAASSQEMTVYIVERAGGFNKAQIAALGAAPALVKLSKSHDLVFLGHA